MKLRILLATAATLTLAACGGDRAETEAADNMAMDNGMEAVPADENAMANAAMPGATAANGQDYVTMAAASDMYEIESSKLAAEKAENADIKAFAQMLLTDHQKSTADLKTAAAEAQPAIMVTPALNAEQQANMEALRGASGAEFDRLFISQQIPAHEKALALVQGYAASGEVESLKQHAANVAGPIEQHLNRARELSR